MSDRRLYLRASLKLLASFATLWILYIFIAGLLGPNEPGSQKNARFDISSMDNNQSTYLAFNQRELLVIRHQQQFYVYWAQDPIYGCRLAYIDNEIRPQCIELHYSVDGKSEKGDVLSSPDYSISDKAILIVRD